MSKKTVELGYKNTKSNICFYCREHKTHYKKRLSNYKKNKYGLRCCADQALSISRNSVKTPKELEKKKEDILTSGLKKIKKTTTPFAY